MAGNQKEERGKGKRIMRQKSKTNTWLFTYGNEFVLHIWVAGTVCVLIHTHTQRQR